MAVPSTDKAVDDCIQDVQDALDKLKVAQKKDDEYYASEDEDTPRDEQPKSLREARIRVREHYRKARQQPRDSGD